MDLFSKNKFKLGFGLMRLPQNEDGSSSVEQTSIMVDKFIEAGGTYFDTAYVYGDSEETARKALVERHPRESYTLASKINAHAPDCKGEEDCKKQLEISLERTGAGYFDFYLLHALGKGNIKEYDEWGIWEFVKEAKEKGLVKHWGFSFHDSPEFLDELLTKHPDAEFVQLQINYADLDNPKVESRRIYEVARKHNKPIVIMEPVKGGALANPIDDVKKIFDEANPNVSYASWAIRYVSSLDGILAVLSGMSNEEQMNDNLSYMKEFKPLDENEKEVIEKARKVLASVNSIPCTDCRYCVEGCPMSIPIPRIFDLRNSQLLYNAKDKAKERYLRVTNEKGKASDCISCGQCEGQCPQHLPIIELLRDCASNLE